MFHRPIDLLVQSYNYYYKLARELCKKEIRAASVLSRQLPRKSRLLFESSFYIITSTLSAIFAFGGVEVVAHGEFEIAGVEALVKVNFADVAIDGCFLSDAAKEIGAGQFDGKAVVPDSFVEAYVELP